MGKIKRERQKFHITAENTDETKLQHNKNSTCKTLPYQPAAKLLDNVQNIFAGINIQLDAMNKFDDTPPKTTKEPLQSEKQTIQTEIPQLVKIDTDNNTKEFTEKHLTKKEKMILKHEKLMQKLDVTQKARLQSKKKTQTMRSLVSTSEVQSMLTPAAVKSSNSRTNNDYLKISKSVFAIPSFNDDFPALDSAIELKSFQKNLNSQKTASKSKSISKNKNGKKSFVNNYNFLRKAMANKTK